MLSLGNYVCLTSKMTYMVRLSYKLYQIGRARASQAAACKQDGHVALCSAFIWRPAMTLLRVILLIGSSMTSTAKHPDQRVIISAEAGCRPNNAHEL